MGLIFNEKVIEKWNLWVCEQYTMCCDLRLLFIEQYMNSNRSTQKAQKRVKRKKKRENADANDLSKRSHNDVG